MTDGLEITDRTGQMRSPEDFREALMVVEKRMLKIPKQGDDIELFMQFTTIREALVMAEHISALALTRKE